MGAGSSVVAGFVRILRRPWQEVDESVKPFGDVARTCPEMHCVGAAFDSWAVAKGAPGQEPGGTFDRVMLVAASDVAHEPVPVTCANMPGAGIVPGVEVDEFMVTWSSPVFDTAACGAVARTPLQPWVTPIVKPPPGDINIMGPSTVIALDDAFAGDTARSGAWAAFGEKPGPAGGRSEAAC
jgi:hypothetical protein